MGLYDVAAAAQGGRCFYNLGRRLQIEEARAAAVVWYLMRALRPSLVSWLGRPGGGVLLLQSLGGDGFEALLNETASFTDGRIRNRGYRLVSQWIASAPLDMVALDQATLASGLGRESLMRILPWIAALQMGALQRAADKPMRTILARIRGKRYAEHVTLPYLALLTELAEAERNRAIGGLDRTLDSLVGRLTGSSSGQSRPARA
jgi:hypothetical protein